ncbi:MAG: prolyl oligopeptidase family serine peptidase, partial [Planctomycetota bacterium]
VFAGDSSATGRREKVFVPSSIDATEQPCYVILPEGFDREGPAAPLLVALHTWSGNVEQRDLKMEAEAEQRGWIYLWPHFRGPNNAPEACGSEKAQRDILDAVDWVLERYPVDKRRIYLTGASGGGHMTMLMAGRYPDRWTAASAWVGISDLAAWHARHAETRYGEMVRNSCGGAPGESASVDEEYRVRSPKTWMHQAVDLPLDLAAGVHDGHKGSVPIRHSLEAFNLVAAAQGLPGVTEEEIAQLSRPDGRLDNPRPGDKEEDPTFGRAIHLRRTAGQARVTIFEGGHEGIAQAAAEWLGRHAKEGPAAAR